MRPSIGAEESDAVRGVLMSGWLVQGEVVAEFEHKLARETGSRYAVAVSSGTAALHAAFVAAGLRPGDAVFIPSFAWPSAANVVVSMGGHVVFVDSSLTTYNIDTVDLEEKIEKCHRDGRYRPRLIVPVHQFGLMANMGTVDEIASRYGLSVVADGACALGSRSNGRTLSQGVSSCTLSFHPRKSITTGEGGAILTEHRHVAEACRAFRNHGQTSSGNQRHFVTTGLNYRLSEVAAAIGLVQLDKFSHILDLRRRVAKRYCEALHGLPSLTVPFYDSGHTFQTFMVLPASMEGARWVTTLRQKGIGAALASIAGHEQVVYRKSFGYRADDLPRASRLGRDGIALPLSWNSTTEEIQTVVSACFELARDSSS
ncbi:DegT/DnrJ/EryC1/StrS family aminotransferase [Gephyromycinifex aptenodytis]|uniref:DegT/DnrJ/EryC1/StrS family aminotransferase n=1 Tax=Gephyromycinifex aptenodytis TaxID=2716227 RepID=UPI001446B7CC